MIGRSRTERMPMSARCNALTIQFARRRAGQIRRGGRFNDPITNHVSTTSKVVALSVA